MIDTGAEGEVRIDSGTAASIGLRKHSSVLSNDGTESTRIMNKFILDSLKIGKLTFKKVEAYSRNYNVNELKRGYRIDGIIGFNLLKDYLLKLDYKTNIVTISTGILPDADNMTILNYTAPSGTPIIDVDIGPLKLSADIDSGDQEGISLPKWIVDLVPADTVPKKIGRGSSLSNTFIIYEVTANTTLRLGKYYFFNPVITYTTVFDNLNLGSAWLNNFSVTFDQKNKRVEFLKN